MKSGSTLTLKEQLYFSKRLGFLLKAGTSLEEALIMLARNSKKKKVFDVLLQDIAQGTYLYQSLKKFPRSFGPLAISLIRSGEESSSLADNCDRLAVELQKRHALRQKIISALMYPSFIAAATILLSGFLLFFIFPKIKPLFKSLSVDLPWSTRLLMAITQITLMQALITSLIVSAIIFIFIYSVKKFPVIRQKKDLGLLHLPLLGKLLKHYELVTYTYTIGIMLSGGTPIDQACSVGIEVCHNTLYKESAKTIYTNTSHGKKFSDSLALYPKLFPQEITDMISTAEAAGTLTETLLYISKMYEQELEESTKNLSSALEPLLMVGMGLIVGFISLSIITPIYTLTQNIKH